MNVQLDVFSLILPRVDLQLIRVRSFLLLYSSERLVNKILHLGHSLLSKFANELQQCFRRANLKLKFGVSCDDLAPKILETEVPITAEIDFIF